MTSMINNKTVIVDGKSIAEKILTRLQGEVVILRQQGINPKLGVFLVGDDKPSHTYVHKKKEACESIGVDFLLKEYKENITGEELMDAIEDVQENEDLTGLIVQLPLPEHIDVGRVVKHIKPEIDVDCLTETNLGKLIVGNYCIEPPTPGAILEILKHHDIDLKGQNIVLMGAGTLIGRPLANLLFHRGATLTVCNSSTKNLTEFTKQADIIISGVGKHNLIIGDMIKKGAVVVDAGVCFVEGKMYGDINFDQVSKKASLITPTPGGVGPLTVAKLVENTIKCARNR
jgi:methylenetetrahydrofolate dehydrogenase (NADP+) / methenyltetrahydrofolate cyclohydrolase